jgi:cell division protein FtsB
MHSTPVFGSCKLDELTSFWNRDIIEMRRICTRMRDCAMNKQPIRLPVIPADVITVLATTGIVFLLLAFGGKALEAYRLERHNAMLRDQAATFEKQQQGLKERRDYVQTPEYVEKTAREQYKWTKAGDKLVITIFQRRTNAPPVASSEATGTRPPAGLTGSTTPPFWSEWWRQLAGPFD